MEYLKNKEWLVHQYLELCKPERQIARELGLKRHNVTYWRKKHGILPRPTYRPPKDLKGYDNGHIIVLESSKNDDGHTRWKCQCRCGSEFDVSSTEILKKRKGCAKCRGKNISDTKWSGYGDISREKFGHIKHSAIRRNIDFQVTIEELWDLFLSQNKRCAITNLPIDFSRTHKNRSKATASLDRIDSRQGYIAGNIQWVHKDINRMKSDFDQKYFMELVQLVYRNNF